MENYKIPSIKNNYTEANKISKYSCTITPYNVSTGYKMSAQVQMPNFNYSSI